MKLSLISVDDWYFHPRSAFLFDLCDGGGVTQPFYAKDYDERILEVNDIFRRLIEYCRDDMFEKYEYVCDNIGRYEVIVAFEDRYNSYRLSDGVEVIVDCYRAYICIETDEDAVLFRLRFSK